MKLFQSQQWALILGGSSGFGLATAKKLSACGMSICVVHRDRRGAMPRIQEEFDAIKKMNPNFISINEDALSSQGRENILKFLAQTMGDDGKVHVLLHSIALGNLKPIVVQKKSNKSDSAVQSLAQRLGIDPKLLETEIKASFDDSSDEFFSLIQSDYGTALINDEDVANTIYSMGTSLLTWTQDIFQRQMFSSDARVLGLTSEGNEVAWRGYAAVSCAKTALEAVSRSIAVEYAPYGIRSNVIQPGVTDTPALRAIPGNNKMKSSARLRNPFGRLTTPEDVAGVVAMLCTSEMAWINGSIIRVDGGEHVSAP